MLDATAYAQQCAHFVEPQRSALILRVTSTESSFNPYAIGVVGGRLERQPTSKTEALATIAALDQGGWNFSVGLLQVNKFNLPRLQLSYADALDLCPNIRAATQIYEDCLSRAPSRHANPKQADREALSCYYSGNYTRGFQPDAPGKASYVDKVLAEAEKIKALRVIPNPGVDVERPPQRDRAAGVAATTRGRPTSVQQLKARPMSTRERRDLNSSPPSQADAQRDPNVLRF